MRGYRGQGEAGAIHGHLQASGQTSCLSDPKHRDPDPMHCDPDPTHRDPDPTHRDPDLTHRDLDLHVTHRHCIVIRIQCIVVRIQRIVIRIIKFVPLLYFADPDQFIKKKNFFPKLSMLWPGLALSTSLNLVLLIL